MTHLHVKCMCRPIGAMVCIVTYIYTPTSHGSITILISYTFVLSIRLFVYDSQLIQFWTGDSGACVSRRVRRGF